MRDTLRDRPLWQQRILVVLLSPVLVLIALAMALNEGWFEFWWELKSSARDVADIWKGKR